MFNYGHIHHYLVESVSHNTMDTDDSDDGDGDATTAKPLRKGSALVTSDFVEDLQDHSSGNYYCLRARVWHSMKKDDALKTFISLSKISGAVSQAKCNCKASALARCAHIAAVLIKLDNFVKESGHTVDVPSTSKTCVWNRGKKRKNDPREIHTDYPSTSTTRSTRSQSKKRIITWDPRCEGYQTDLWTTDDMNRFVKDNKVGVKFLCCY